MITGRSKFESVPKTCALLLFTILFQEIRCNFGQFVDNGSRFVERRDLVVLTGVHTGVESCSKNDQGPDDTHVTTRDSDASDRFEEAEDFEAVDEKNGGHEQEEG